MQKFDVGLIRDWVAISEGVWKVIFYLFIYDDCLNFVQNATLILYKFNRFVNMNCDFLKCHNCPENIFIQSLKTRPSPFEMTIHCDWLW